MTLGAFSRGPDKAGCGLSANTTALKRWTGVVDNERSHDEGCAQENRDEKGLERHGQMSGAGGMISFDLGTRARARRFLGRLRLGTLAESLGGVETLASYPAEMTHGFLKPDERRRLGVTDGLVRISVGIEAVEDLLEDLEHALA